MAKVSNAWGMTGWEGGRLKLRFDYTMYIHVTEINSFSLS